MILVRFSHILAFVFVACLGSGCAPRAAVSAASSSSLREASSSPQASPQLPTTPAKTQKVEEVSLDVLLNLERMTREEKSGPAYRVATLQVDKWKDTRTGLHFCVDEGGQHVIGVQETGNPVTRRFELKTSLPGFSDPGHYREPKPCGTEGFFTPKTATGEQILQRRWSGFDQDGRWARTFEALPVKVPAEAKDAEYMQIHHLKDRRHLIYWTSHRQLLAIRLFDERNKRWTDVPLPKQGRIGATPDGDAFYLATERIDRQCLGVFAFDGTGFSCASIPIRNRQHSVKRRPGGWLLTRNLYEDLWWDRELPHGWKLRTILPAGKSISRSELIGPTGERYQPYDDADATCYFEQEVQTERRRFLALRCRHHQLQSHRYFWWDPDAARGWTPKEESAHVDTLQLGRAFVVTGHEVRRWMKFDQAGLLRLISLGDQVFVAPEEGSEPAPIPYRRNVGPLRMALMQRKGRTEVVEIDWEASRYRVVRQIKASACPGTIGWGYRPINRDNTFVLHCVSPLQKGTKGEGLHQWSEIVNANRGWRWRTHQYIQAVGADGTVLMTDTRRHTVNGSDHRAIYLARPRP